jgi:hypothetical protein
MIWKRFKIFRKIPKYYNEMSVRNVNPKQISASDQAFTCAVVVFAASDQEAG